jgi:hypothetical protein
VIIELWQSKELKNSPPLLNDAKAIRLIIYGCGDRTVIIIYPVDTHRVICDVT